MIQEKMERIKFEFPSLYSGSTTRKNNFNKLFSLYQSLQ